MKNVLNYLFIISVATFLFSCSGESLDDTVSEIQGETITVNFTYIDLIGIWNLSNMHTDVAVDLNNDGVKKTNLKEETTCFDPMAITFNGDMTFSSINSRMDFAADGANTFECMGGRTDSGTWSLDGNVLTLNGVINGSFYTHKKELTFENNTFKFNITELESQQYVKDPGNTLISDVTIVYLEYTKI